MWQKIRRWGLEMYAFLTAPFVVRNCLSMIGVMAGIFFLTFGWLKCYTAHGDSTQVPNYVGLSFREAAKKVRSRDFNAAISDSIYIPGKPPGEVISQNPKADSYVKEGRTVYFTVTKNNPDIVRLPGLVGRDDYEMYSRKLSRMGLKPRIAARIAMPRFAPNTIIAVLYRGDTITQKIRQGYSVEVGAMVDFVVTEEETLTVNVPDCMCKTFDAVRFIIEASGLSLGTVVKDATVTNQETAYIWKQTPKYNPNEIMRKGESIDLYLTQEKPKSCSEVIEED